MLVNNYATIRPNELGTRTVEDFSKFLGSKPHRLGIVARQNPDLTTSFLTESLMNIYDVESKNKYQPISSFLIEWEVEQSYIKRVKFTTVPSSTGKWGAPVTFIFDEAYFGKYDTFRIERTRQQGIIVSNARRISDKSFEYQVQLVTNNDDEEFDLTGCQAGMAVRWIGTAHPEMSEEGNVKSQSNMELHRNYITRHRSDVEYSSDFETMEDVYITLGKSDSDTGTVYKMLKKEQQLLETFMIARNQMNLLSKCNVDKNGKARNFDPNTNRPIVIGDGVIPQIERFADKYAYSRLTTDVFDTVLSAMRQKSKKSIGNQYTFVVNELLWDDIQKNLRDYLKSWKTSGTVFFSQKNGKNVEIGATFETYTMGGNQLTFMVDKSLSLEYDQKPYGFCLDLTADLASGKPAMQMFSLKGKEFVRHVLKGVGSDSVEVSTVVAASRIINMGYSSVCVFSPHRSYIIEGNRPNKY